uniref:Chromosome 11 open reading frame 53 n=1 Tax=Nothoprocta perdicaria TaxID=30464 RepID=A0A8C7E9R1_NOTPE
MPHPFFPTIATGSPTATAYYGVRRSFMAELDFHNTKQFASDVCSPPPGSKPLPCDSSAVQGYSALLDPYLPEQYGDHSRTAPFTSSTSSFFSPSSLPSLLPSFPNDTAHILLREPWEQTSPDSLGQPEGPCSDSLQAMPASAGCLSSHETGSTSPYRSSGWVPAVPGAQPYLLHPLEEVHYSSSYAATAPYSFSPLMTVANELTARMNHLSPEPSSDAQALHDSTSWAKEDGGPLWGTYDGRRTY